MDNDTIYLSFNKSWQKHEVAIKLKAVRCNNIQIVVNFKENSVMISFLYISDGF